MAGLTTAMVVIMAGLTTAMEAVMVGLTAVEVMDVSNVSTSAWDLIHMFHQGSADIGTTETPAPLVLDVSLSIQWVPLLSPRLHLLLLPPPDPHQLLLHR